MRTIPSYPLRHDAVPGYSVPVADRDLLECGQNLTLNGPRHSQFCLNCGSLFRRFAFRTYKNFL